MTTDVDALRASMASLDAGRHKYDTLHLAKSVEAILILQARRDRREAEWAARLEGEAATPAPARDLPEALASGDVATTRALVAEGKGVTDPQGATALHWGCRWRDEVLALAALNCEGSDVNAVDSSGETVLHAAARRGLAAASRAILARADFRGVNARDGTGSTALHLAARGDFAATVAALLEHPDIDSTIFDAQQRTALDLAEAWEAQCPSASILRTRTRHS